MPQISNPMEPTKQGTAMFPWAIDLMHLLPEEYYNDTKNLSFSMLKEGYRNIEILSMSLKGYKMNKQTTAMDEGIQYHMAVLETERYNARFLVFDDSRKIAEIGGAMPRGTKAYKEFVAEVEAEATRLGRVILPMQKHVVYQQMIDKLASVSLLNSMIHDTFRELAIVKEHMGIRCKGLVDITDGVNYNIDLKKVHFDKPGMGFNYEQLDKYIDAMDYDAQQWWYKELTGVKEAYLLFQMDSYPFTPALVKLSDATLQRGKNKFEWMLQHAAKQLDGTGELRTIPYCLNITI